MSIDDISISESNSLSKWSPCMISIPGKSPISEPAILFANCKSFSTTVTEATLCHAPLQVLAIRLAPKIITFGFLGKSAASWPKIRRILLKEASPAVATAIRSFASKRSSAEGTLPGLPSLF